MGMAMHDTPPTIQEELDRKTLDYLTTLEYWHNTGVISEAEYRAGVLAAWEMVSGLTGKWLFEYYSQVHFDEQSQDFVLRRVFSRGGGVVIVQSRLRSGIVKVIPLNGKVRQFNYTEEVCPSTAAKRQMEAIIQLLIQQGYTEHE